MTSGRAALLAALFVLPAAPRAQQPDPAPAVVVLPADSSPVVRLAASEVRRYAWLCTDALLPITTAPPAESDAVALAIDPDLAEEEHRLRTTRGDRRRILTITGGSDVAVLYGAYVFAEHLGVRFHLHGDSVPDDRVPFAVPDVDETHEPLFATRGILPFHDFSEGPDWWTLDDYRAYLAQMAKLRLNLIGLHCYPEGQVGPEPLVWIGPPDDVAPDGTVRHAYAARWASTHGGAWGYAPTRTSEFAAGASLLFASDEHGAPATDGLRPLPRTESGQRLLFERTGRFLDSAFSFGRALGVQSCVGTETPLTVPATVAERLRAGGLDPADPAIVRALYRGMFLRIARTHPLDYYWLWTPEGWTWGGDAPGALDATLADIAAAAGALDDLGNPFTLATCGWVLGPRRDRAALDRNLPPDSPMSCIDRNVGFAFVEPAFARVDGRPKWAIPWLEDDPNMIGAQLWVGRVRRDAADAHAYGCTGLLGIHWRTRVLAPNVRALAEAAWGQRGWNADFGERVAAAPRRDDVRLGGNAADYAHSEIAGTDLDPVYRTCRWSVGGYRVRVPDGTVDVTLQLCEVHYGAPGMRVFDVALQGRTVATGVDVFDRVGKDVALDLRFEDVEVRGGVLDIAFGRRVEHPFVAGIVIEGDDFVRKINCGGGAVLDYEADLPEDGDVDPRGPRPRDLPCDDLFADWARAEFGEEVAAPVAAIFARLDGGAGDYASDRSATKLPRPSEWLGGPGAIQPNPVPWETERARYAFVDELETLAPKVRGAGHRERFGYWLHTLRFHRALGELGCIRGLLDRIVARIAAEADETAQRRMAREEALPVRIRLARGWESMMTELLQAVSTPGELGTIANLEQHTRRNLGHARFLDLHDAALEGWLGAPLPVEAQPTREYVGPPRIVVPTARSVVRAGEVLELTVIVLDRAAPDEAVLLWRPLGAPDEREIALTHVARGVHSVRLPPAEGDVFEYRLRVRTRGGATLHWPATAPERGQTVSVLPESD